MHPSLGRVVDGWSQSGKLVTGSPNNIVSLQADFTKIGADVFTVQFALSAPVDGAFRAIATVTWTVEGNQIVRQLDVSNGASISAPAQSVKVIVNDVTPPEVGAPSGETYGVTISVTKGSRPYGAVPVTLKAVGPSGDTTVFSLGSGATQNFAIPEGAGVTSVEVTAGTDLVGITPDVFIQHANSIAAFKVYKYGDQGSGTGFVAISPMATFVSLTNLNASHAVLVAVTWGIDG